MFQRLARTPLLRQINAVTRPSIHRGFNASAGLYQHEDDMERYLAMEKKANQEVQTARQQLEKEFGGSGAPPERLWMATFYRRRTPELLPGAIAAMCAARSTAPSPSHDASMTAFSAAALANLPSADLKRCFTVLNLAADVPPDALCAILHAAAAYSSECAHLRDALVSSVQRLAQEDVARLFNEITAVPSKPIVEWPIPYEDETLSVKWREGPQVYDMPSTMKALKQDLVNKGSAGFHDYVLMASTALVESLWATFFATGDRQCIHRVADIAEAWVDFQHCGIDYIVDIEQRLPENVTHSPEDSVRAQASRVAAWSLLTYTHTHEAATQVLAEICGDLSPFMLSKDADRTTTPLMSAEVGHRRLQLFPGLLHLSARASNQQCGSNGGGRVQWYTRRCSFMMVRKAPYSSNAVQHVHGC